MKRVIKLVGLILIVLISVSGTTYTKTSFNKLLNKSNCKATLEVKQNRNTRSVKPNSGVSYYLILKNTSNKTSTYKLTSESLKNSCYTKDDKNLQRATKNENIFLEVSFNKNTLSKTNFVDITLKSGESKKVEVRLFTAIDTPIKRWNCTEIKAVSVDCNTVVASTVLKTYIANPQER